MAFTDAMIAWRITTQCPWFHIVILIYKLEDPAQRGWYALQTIEQGWLCITLNLHEKNRQAHITDWRNKHYETQVDKSAVNKP